MEVNKMHKMQSICEHVECQMLIGTNTSTSNENEGRIAARQTAIDRTYNE